MSISGRARIINSTVVNNQDTTEAGGIAFAPSFGSDAEVVNSILWGNNSVNTFNEQFSTSSQFQTFVYHSTVEGGIGTVGGTNNSQLNPQFVNPSAGAGIGFSVVGSNWRVDSCTSPVIDAGVRDTLIGNDFMMMDLAGNLRNTRGTIDQGAYETPGTSNEGAWTSTTVCSNDSLISLMSAHPRYGVPSASTFQIDTGTGWFTVTNGMFPELSISNDTITLLNAPLEYSFVPGRVINTYACWTDTTPAWNPDTLSPSYDSADVFGCQGDTVMLGGGMQTASGTYVDVLVNSGGCDSILTTELLLYPSPTFDVFDTICFGDSLSWNGSFYTSAGQYDQVNAIVYSGATCDSTTFLHLVVLPDLSPASTETTIGCLGDTITFDLTDPNFASYSWSDGTNTGTGSSFSIIPSNSFERVFVTVTDINGYAYSATRDYLQFTLDAYAISVDPTNDPFVTFDWVVGPPSNADDFWWDFGDGDTSHQVSITHEYTSNGNFNYCGVVTSQCGLEASCNDLDIFRVSLEEFSAAHWSVYPNPANEFVVFNAKQNESASIRIYSVSGKLVLEQAFEGEGEHSIDLSALAAGNYFLEVEMEAEVQRLPLVKF